MAGNTFGTLFRITTFGESHGEAIGVVIDGCPAGLEIDEGFVQAELDRRRPGQSSLTTQRSERDRARFLSGIHERRTTGTPIAAWLANEDQRPADYAEIAQAFRPSHADFTYQAKYGHRDPRGGGRSSARETAARVLAGAVAKLLLRTQGVEVAAWVSQVADVVWDGVPDDLSLRESNDVRCPDAAAAARMVAVIEGARADGDTVGGVVSGLARGVPVGLGEPVFDKLHADLGKAMLSINAVKGFEYGSGFAGVRLRGSQHNDEFVPTSGGIATRTNHSGGIQGGISNGMDIVFRVAFKPVATIARPQATVDLEGNPTTLTARGRHDPCVVPRAVPIVEAMTALVLADHWLRNRVAVLSGGVP